MTTYTGGCHCGAVKFEFESDLETVITCNCSNCYMRGLVLVFVPASSFRLLTPRDALTDYQFNTKKIHHYFCTHCGIESFGEGERKDGTPTNAVNLRCVAGIDLDTLTVTQVDGKSF